MTYRNTYTGNVQHPRKTSPLEASMLTFPTCSGTHGKKWKRSGTILPSALSKRQSFFSSYGRLLNPVCFCMMYSIIQPLKRTTCPSSAYLEVLIKSKKLSPKRCSRVWLRSLVAKMLSLLTYVGWLYAFWGVLVSYMMKLLVSDSVMLRL